MQKRSAVVLSCLALAAGLALGHFVPRWLPAGEGSAAAPPPKPASAASGKPIAVEVGPVVKRPFDPGITAVGSLRSDESVMLRPEVAGRISRIAFTEGQRVARGQVLIQLDDAVPRAELEQARANFSLARSNHDRANELQQKGFISKQARDEADNAMRVQQAAMSLAQARLDKSEIKAPFSGVIGLRNVSLGDYVGVGQDMVQIESIDPLKVDFRIPEIYLSRIRNGQSLHITLDALPGKTFSGTVYAISPLIDVGGRAIVMRAQVRNPGAVLRPGMFARLRLMLGEQSDALFLPEDALVPVGEAHFVYRVEQDRAVRVPVQIGARRDGEVEIVSGLAEGDSIVVAGTQKLRDGAAIAATAAQR